MLNNQSRSNNHYGPDKAGPHYRESHDMSQEQNNNELGSQPRKDVMVDYGTRRKKAVFEIGNEPRGTIYGGFVRRGKSILPDLIRKQAKAEGRLLVDLDLYYKGRGLKPYEHEYARRFAEHIQGPLPRELRGKKITVIATGRQQY